jgi:YHS domain-containing protein
VTVQDPFCAMDVAAQTITGQTVYTSKIYYFCVRRHKEYVDRNPDQYVGKSTGVSKKSHYGCNKLLIRKKGENIEVCTTTAGPLCCDLGSKSGSGLHA